MMLNDPVMLPILLIRRSIKDRMFCIEIQGFESRL